MLKKTKIIGIAGLLIGLLFYSLNAVAEDEAVVEAANKILLGEGAVLEGVLANIINHPRPDSYYDQQNREDDNRRSALDQARKRYTGPKCEGDSKCEKYCKDIYNRRSVREDCTDLSLAQVKNFGDIYKTFENPTEEGLNNIDPEDFKVFAEIDIRPLEKRIEKFNIVQAKRVLAWIVDDESIAEVFLDEDDNFDLLKELLEKLHTDKKTALADIPVYDGDSLMELAIEEYNAVALDWIHGFFGEECDSNFGWELCILKNWYCQVKLNDDSWDELVGYENFEDMVSYILLDYPVSSPPAWWTEDTEARDLTVGQLKSLCNVEWTLIMKETDTEKVDTGEVGTTETTSSESN